MAGPSLAALVRLVSERGPGPLEVICHKRDAAAPSDSPAESRLRVPCLAWLSTPLMLALVGLGAEPLYLDDRLCADCRLGSAHAGILALAAVAIEILSDFGRGAIVVVSESGSSRTAPHAVPMLDPARPAYSRRDLFGALRRSAASVAATVASDGTTAAPKVLSVLAPPQLGLRTAALRRLAAGSGVEQANVVVPLPYVGVTSECTACGLCAKLCPTGAMTIWQDDVQYSLQYAARLCLGQTCSVCAHICPVRAVTVTRGVTLKQLLTEEPVGLRAGSLVPCSRCGVPVAKTEDAPVCHACRWTRSAGSNGLAHGAGFGASRNPVSGPAGQGYRE